MSERARAQAREFGRSSSEDERHWSAFEPRPFTAPSKGLGSSADAAHAPDLREAYLRQERLAFSFDGLGSTVEPSVTSRPVQPLKLGPPVADRVAGQAVDRFRDRAPEKVAGSPSRSGETVQRQRGLVAGDYVKIDDGTGVVYGEIVRVLAGQYQIRIGGTEDTLVTKDEAFVAIELATGKRTEEDLSEADKGRLSTTVEVALKRCHTIGGEWASFIEKAQKTSSLSPTDASVSASMIKKMIFLKLLGEALSSKYGSLDLSARLSLKPRIIIRLISPHLSRLVKEKIRITVNGLAPGGTFSAWRSMSDMRNYLDLPYDTFISVFKSQDGRGRLRLLQTLRSGDTNIEKFVTLMQAFQVEELLASGPQGKLEAEFASHPTASGGTGVGLVNVALNYLWPKFLNSKYTKQQIIDLDFEESRASLESWMSSQGYTMEIIRDAVRNCARSSTSRITSEEVREQWEGLMKSHDFG